MIKELSTNTEYGCANFTWSTIDFYTFISLLENRAFPRNEGVEHIEVCSDSSIIATDLSDIETIEYEDSEELTNSDTDYP